MKNTKQPHPRLTDLRLRKEIASLLNVTASTHGFEAAYLELRDGMWEILKKREPVVALKITEYNGKQEELEPIFVEQAEDKATD